MSASGAGPTHTVTVTSGVFDGELGVNESAESSSRTAARPRATPARARFALFSYGFRPFFLMAGVHAAIAVPAWMAVVHGVSWTDAPLSALSWHAHEMLYGFVMAAVAGFLLTAVPSWTGQRGFAGPPLIALVLVWIAGRVVVSVPLGFPPALIAAVDLAFPIALAIAISPSLMRSGNRRNVVFVALLALLLTANLRFHLDGAASIEPLRLGLNTVLVMLTLVGGRIVPAFTSARLKQRGLDVQIPHHPIIDTCAIAAVIAVLVVDTVSPNGTSSGAVAAIAAFVLTLRLARWHGHRTLHEPLLWVLHVAYAWLPVALTLKSAWLLGALAPAASWTHALTIGAFSTMILAVMTRASLGHTGRALVASRGICVAYLLLTAAALARVFGPAVVAGDRTTFITAAAVLWTAAFSLFLVIFVPILCRPRVDGRPG